MNKYCNRVILYEIFSASYFSQTGYNQKLPLVEVNGGHFETLTQTKSTVYHNIYWLLLRSVLGGIFSICFTPFCFLRVEKEDEMSCLITGCNFVLKNIRDEVFIYHRHGNPEYKFESFDPEGMFPYVLVNIGSGVSIVKVGQMFMKIS